MGHCCSYRNMATRQLHGSRLHGQGTPSALVGRKFFRRLFLRLTEIKPAQQKVSAVSEDSKRPCAMAERFSPVIAAKIKSDLQFVRDVDTRTARRKLEPDVRIYRLDLISIYRSASRREDAGGMVRRRHSATITSRRFKLQTWSN